MMVFDCDSCGKAVECAEIPHRGKICFGCHIRTVQMKFTWGKEDFHGPTIRERQVETVRAGRAAGLDPEPVTNWM